MKLRNFLTILLCTGMFFSCAQEESIMLASAEDVTIEANTSIDLILTAGNISTKAIPGGVYEWASEDELNVDKCFVAVFKDGVRVDNGVLATISGGTLVKTGSYEASTPADTLSYKVSGVPGKTGKVTIVAIANYSDPDPTKKLSTFTNLEDLMDQLYEVTQFTAEFDPKSLVKVGVLEDYVLSFDNNDDILIPMVQLAARVDLKLVVDIEGDVTKRSVDMLYTNEMLAQIKSAAQGSTSPTNPLEFINSNGDKVLVWSCDKESGSEKHDLIYKGKNYLGLSQYKKIHFSKAIIDSVLVSDFYALDIKSVTINNIQTKTKLILPVPQKNYTNPFQEDFLEPAWKRDYSPAVRVKDTLKISFYTYEKQYYNYTNPADLLNTDAIEISIDGDLIKGERETRKRYEVAGAWAIGTDGKGNATNGSFNYFDYGDDVNFAPTDEGKVIGEFTTIQGVDPIPKTYRLFINPNENMEGCNTNGLIHGNLYSVTAVIKELPSVSQEITLDWLVNPWVREPEVNIGFN